MEEMASHMAAWATAVASTMEAEAFMVAKAPMVAAGFMVVAAWATVAEAAIAKT